MSFHKAMPFVLASCCWASLARQIEEASQSSQRRTHIGAFQTDHRTNKHNRFQALADDAKSQPVRLESLATLLLAAHAKPGLRSRTARRIAKMSEDRSSGGIAPSPDLATRSSDSSVSPAADEKGVVVPLKQPIVEPVLNVTDSSADKKSGHLGIKELLTEYGVIALGFHFSVWITCLATVYALLSFGLDLSVIFAKLGIESAESAGFAGRITATLGLVEVIGPARVALTAAATPTVSKWARKIKAIRDLEQFLQTKWDELRPGQAK
mmetsp:Transcript_68484/g.107936  ORF Transcript_68484/g.107936 Transcript_68484/m.107936 type:complete len:267 (-) Transcript_68484:53-853(-)